MVYRHDCNHSLPTNQWLLFGSKGIDTHCLLGEYQLVMLIGCQVNHSHWLLGGAHWLLGDTH